MAGAVLSQDGSISVLDSIRQTIEESAGGDPGIFYTFWADVYKRQGSCSAVACLPIVTALFHLFVYHSEPLMVAFCTVMALGIAAILIGKHWPNLKRIRSGTESKLSFGSKKGNS